MTPIYIAAIIGLVILNIALVICIIFKFKRQKSDKSSGHRVQDVDISYNYIGILPVSLLNDLINGTAA